ncbi:hypothetical protein BBP40_008692 [Aspergillus hancockii]|nr:hypothetical protein BBP40_008692 [Aspergillus hancockii]
MTTPASVSNEPTQRENVAISWLQAYIIVAFAATAIWNGAELVILCLSTFKRYRGTYFWSLLIASVSVILHTVGGIFLDFQLSVSPYIYITLILVSWYGMVTGHSVIHWSRLHVILVSQKVLRATLVVIVVDAILFHVPITVLVYGALSSGHVGDRFKSGYIVMECIQAIGFCLQELLLSATYIWETAKILRLRPGPLQHRILLQSITINAFIIILDIAVVAILFSGHYEVQLTFKSFVYSMKFKLEYVILNRLVRIARGPSSDPETLSSGLDERNSPTCGPRVYGSNSMANREVRDLAADTLSRHSVPHRA